MNLNLLNMATLNDLRKEYRSGDLQSDIPLTGSATPGATPGATPSANTSVSAIETNDTQVGGQNRFAEGTKNFLGGATFGFSSIGRNIQNTLSKGVDKVFGTEGFGKATKEGFEQATGTDLDTTSAKIGEFAGEVIPYVVQPGAAAIKGAAGVGGRVALNTAIGTAQTGDIKDGLVIGAGGEALAFGGKILQQVGRGVYKLAIPLSAREAKIVQTYKANNTLTERFRDFSKGNSKAPVTAEETAFNKGLKGTQSMIGVEAKRNNQRLWDEVISPSLKKSEAKVNLNEFFQEAQENIVKNNPELTRQKALLNALEAVKDDYKGVDIISVEKLQDLKSGWAEFLPQKAFKGEDIAGAAKEVRNELSGMARSKIYTVVDDPAVQQAYIDYGNLIGLQKWGQTAMTGGKLEGGSGGFVNALKDVVVVPTATIGGRTVYRTGEGIEFVGAAGAKTLNDIINQTSPQQQTE